MICLSYTLSGQVTGNAARSFSTANSIGFANSSNNQNLGNLLAQTAGLSLSETNQSVYKKLEGSPYLNEGPVKGSFILNEGRKVEEVLLEIDLHTNQAIATVEDEEKIFLNSNFIKEIHIDHKGETLVFKRINPKRPDRFFQVLYEADGLVFFKDRQATISEAFDNGIVQRKAAISHRSNYYIRKKDKVDKVSLKKKSIFSKFTKREANAMNKYAKANSLNLKDELDFAKVFKALDAI